MRKITLNIEEETYKLFKKTLLLRSISGQTSTPDRLLKRIMQGIEENEQEITLKRRG
jgi:hypothetical protein